MSDQMHCQGFSILVMEGLFLILISRDGYLISYGFIWEHYFAFKKVSFFSFTMSLNFNNSSDVDAKLI